MSTTQSRSTNGYTSPLENLLADLRRKYVAAAGPQISVGGLGSSNSGPNDAFLMQHSLLPTTHPIEIDINATNRKTSFAEDDRAVERMERRKSLKQITRNSSMVFGRRRSVGRRSSFTGMYGVNSLDNLSPRSLAKQCQRGPLGSVTGSAQDDGSGGPLPSSFLDQRAAFLECATRYRSGISSKSHAENLIACAPHLRNISQASADMQGNGSSSRNSIAAFFLKQGRIGENTSEATGGAGSFISDYLSSLARKRTNHRVASELATFVQVLANEMSNEEFGVVENEIISKILNFMHSSDCNKRLAGVAALDALIGVTSADEEKKITKFGRNLSDSLFKASNVDYEFLSEVTIALGKMARGGTNVDYVESVVKRVPEWLKRDRSDRRYVEVTVLYCF
jgi:hypothetical protein